MFRVVANLTKCGFTCQARWYPTDHPRVQELRYDPRVGKYRTKWERAYSTKCEGKWVGVWSEFFWHQEPPPPYEYYPGYKPSRGPVYSIPENENKPGDDREPRQADSPAIASTYIAERFLGPRPDCLWPAAELHEGEDQVATQEQFMAVKGPEAKGGIQASSAIVNNPEPFEEPPPDDIERTITILPDYQKLEQDATPNSDHLEVGTAPYPIHARQGMVWHGEVPGDWLVFQ